MQPRTRLRLVFGWWARVHAQGMLERTAAWRLVVAAARSAVAGILRRFKAEGSELAPGPSGSAAEIGAMPWAA